MKDKVVLIASGAMVIAGVALTIMLAPFTGNNSGAQNAVAVAGNAPAATNAPAGTPQPQGGNTIIQAQPGQTVDGNGQISDGVPQTVQADETDDLHQGPIQPDEPVGGGSDGGSKANAQDQASNNGQTAAPSTNENGQVQTKGE